MTAASLASCGSGNAGGVDVDTDLVPVWMKEGMAGLPDNELPYVDPDSIGLILVTTHSSNPYLDAEKEKEKEKVSSSSSFASTTANATTDAPTVDKSKAGDTEAGAVKVEKVRERKKIVKLTWAPLPGTVSDVLLLIMLIMLIKLIELIGLGCIES